MAERRAARVAQDSGSPVPAGGQPAFDDIFEPGAAAASAAPIQRATDLTGVHVLKHEERFMLSDAHGDVHPDRRGLGLYEGDTRVLSTYELRVNGARPVVLRAGPAAHYRSTIQLTNPDLVSAPPRVQDRDESEIVLRRHSLGVVRERVVTDGFAEKVTITNYTTGPEPARLTLHVDADYADIFELRGLVRERRGDRLANEGDGSHAVLAYRGLDGLVRRTHVTFDPPLSTPLSDGRLRQPEHGALMFELDWTLPPGGHKTLSVETWSETLAADAAEQSPALAAVAPRIAADQAEAAHRAWKNSSTLIETSNPLAERAIERAGADLRLLLNSGQEPGERYIAAGVPWFSCLFGRDALITAMQLLSIRPQIAQSTLAVLARLQATHIDPVRDAQPGKILHELRTGELARTGEIPHAPYYGTVDATPLWLMLLDEYERWTADLDTVRRLWPNALAALAWIDDFGDLDGDGLVEYERQSERGLQNQGWKDSGDAIRFRDGRLAEGAIALAEVQGYVFAARRGMARLARLIGDDSLAAAQDRAADRLRDRFEEAFWLPDAGTYAMALDGAKSPVDGIGSNAGHVLWAGLASPERAASVARVLTGPGMWSGWGIRTLSSDNVGFNPIGYHLGTVWPHDNAICATGFARYGLREEALMVSGTLLEAAVHFRESRLPELFCGFDRAASPLPVPYPVACSPQAWAAGSLYQLIGASLGLRADAAAKRLELVNPALPTWLPGLRLRNLRVGEAIVDLGFLATDGSVAVDVLRRTGDLDVVVRL